MKTFFIDVMLNDRFQFTMPYKYCPAFKLDIEDVNRKVLAKRPSLKGKPYEIWIDG